MQYVDDGVAFVVAAWAAAQPAIERGQLFGSRVHGSRRRPM
jgi:hypothetical protein